MIGPTRKPQEFGFKRGDSHLLANDFTERLTAYSFEGKKLWDIPALCRGQLGNWRRTSGDTPPGLYKLGEVFNDYAQVGDRPVFDRTLRAYGWITFDMVDLEGNEDSNDRAGICLHGGGTACGWPAAWAPNQALYPTLGCVRIYNVDLRDKVLPLVKQGTVFVSVYQDY